MRRVVIARLTLLCGALALAGAGPGRSETPDAAARAAIKTALLQWPKDFAAKDARAVCGLFAPDLEASYPGGPDRNYDAMCKHLTAVLNNPDKTFRYDAPRIDDILVSGDLAVVRLVWTLRVTEKGKPGETVIRERGIDVFKRQKDGAWRISISHAYPEEPAK